VVERRRGHELGLRQPGWRHPSEEWLRQAEHLADLDSRLPALLTRQGQPKDARERLALAQFCQQYKHLFAASARWYGEAFTQEPKLAIALSNQPRYHAARAAALAGCGQGEDAASLDDQERAHLRQQALTWLRAELALYTSIMMKAPAQTRAALQQRLRDWQENPDLTGLRADALAKLPETEQQSWRTFWAEVQTLRQRAAKPNTSSTFKGAGKP
jgi:hypothetical protein